MYYKQPRYFGEFKCIGAECLDNCCYGWNIDWTADEVNKAKNAENISNELRELMERSFRSANEANSKFNIKYTQEGRCPFQTEEGLCRIQKELGAEYLSRVCTNFPRTNIQSGNVIYRFCRMSCPVIMDKLLNDERCMELMSAPTGKGNIATLNSLDTVMYPEQKYHKDIFEFFYGLISDKNINVESAVIIGAMAANALTKIIDRKEYNSIPEQLKSLKKQIHNGNILKSVSEIKPNYEIKLGFLPKVLERITKNSVTGLLSDNNGRYNIDMYEFAEARLHEQLKEREFFLRNVALQFLFELNVPFYKWDWTLFENYSIYAVAFACVKMNLIASMVTENTINFRTFKHEFACDGDKKFTVLTTLISRVLCQNIDTPPQIINALKEKGYDKTAYLALLIK